MNSFLVIRPPESYSNHTTTCVTIHNNQVSTLEKYPKKYTFKKREQICYSSPSFYSKTLEPHISALLKNRRESSASKDIITVVGFGASGSGKTYNLLGVDSSGIRNKHSILCGIIGAICKTNITNTTIEVTQVYKNHLFVIQPAKKIAINRVYDVFKASLLGWKQQQFSTHNSSRAHLIIKLSFNGLEIRVIDTAGFERPDNEREHTETVAINQDMLAFKECIMAVSSKQQFIPARRRVITRVLFDKSSESKDVYHTFTFGTIDPNHDTVDMKQKLIISNPKHPKLGFVFNTLNYLTMLGCASVVTTRRPISSHNKKNLVRNVIHTKSKANVADNIVLAIASIPSNYADSNIKVKPTKPPGNPDENSHYTGRRLSKPVEQQHVPKPAVEIIKIKQCYDNMSSDPEMLDSRDMMQNIIDNRKKIHPVTPVTRYIQNQTILMNRMNVLDYETDKIKVLTLINDQQLLTITMQMVVLERCD